MKRAGCAALAVVLWIACGAPPPADDMTLILRQRSLSTLEMTVDDTEIVVIVKEKTKVLERVNVRISPRDSTKIRRLFWDAFRRQPGQRLMPVRDLVFEQEWRGRSRVYEMRIQGYPLTPEDRRAFEFINRLLPQRYRFAVDVSLYRRSKVE